MSKFIKLSKYDGECYYYINANSIDCVFLTEIISKSGRGVVCTEIRTRESFFYIKETPEEILSMIDETKASTDTVSENKSATGTWIVSYDPFMSETKVKCSECGRTYYHAGRVRPASQCRNCGSTNKIWEED